METGATETVVVETKEEKNKAMKWAFKIGGFALLYSLAAALITVSTTFNGMDVACRIDLGYSEDVCSHIVSGDADNYTDQQNDVDQVTATIGTWQSILTNILPLICVTYMGPWMDKHGRKWGYAIPLVGGALSCALTIITYYANTSAEVVAALTSITGIFGGTALIQTAVYSNMADVTIPSRRTFWTAISLFFFGIGTGIGSIGGGIIYDALGIWTFGVSLIVYVVCMVYLIFLIPNVRPDKAAEKPNIDEESQLVESDKKTLKEKVKNALQNYVEMAKFAVRKREHNYRTKILLLLIAYVLCSLSVSGPSNVLTMFTNKVLGWSSAEFGSYNGITTFVLIFGSLIVLVPYKFFDLSDSMICAWSSISGFLMYTIMPFAQSTAMMYAATILGTWRDIYIFLVKSLASKIVMTDEIGKVNALFSCGDTVGALVAGPAYSGIYAATVDTVPGAFAILSSCFLLIATAIYLYICISGKIYRNRHKHTGENLVVL